jgi:hypothetical protein
MSGADLLPEREIIYGVTNGCVVVLPSQRALELAAIHEALRSTTWKEFESRVSAEVYEEYREKSGVDELPNFEEFYSEELKSRPGLSQEEAFWQFVALRSDERTALPDDPFPGYDIGPICDGDWPGWPEQEMLSWVPADIQERYGNVRCSVLNGDFLQFSADAGVVADALRRHGYQCRRDDALVARACGR